MKLVMKLFKIIQAKSDFIDSWIWEVKVQILFQEKKKKKKLILSTV